MSKKSLFEQQPNEIEIVEQVAIPKELTLRGKYRMEIDGGSLFEFNPATRMLTKVVPVKSETVTVTGAGVAGLNAKFVVQPNRIYVEALNLRSAVKRLLKGKIAFVG